MANKKLPTKWIEQIVLTPSGSRDDNFVKCELYYGMRVKHEDGTETADKWRQIIGADSLQEGLYNCIEFFEDL